MIVSDKWYVYDKAGRTTTINGSGYAGVTNYASAITYRAFGAVKGMNYANGRSLTTAYDSRMRPTTWNVSSVLGYNYAYDYFNEHTGRATYAGSIYDSTLDRSYEYDQLGRLVISHSGAEARAHAWTGQWGTMDGPYSQGYDYDVWGNVTHKYGWGGEVQGGGAGQSSDIWYSYTGNRRNGFSYDASGNLTNDIGQTFTYDATGQQTASTYTNLQNWYDGDGLRVKRTEDGPAPALFLRSSVLGGQVVAELDYVNGSWQWWRGYVYAGSQLLAVQDSGVYWMHEDPVTKSKRVTNSAGAVVSTIELDPWGADTNRSNNAAFQPKKFTSYERDANGSDEAMFRRYNRWHSRFDQPDPYDGSYDATDPQSFNRYTYVQGDPVNFIDPSGLRMCYRDIDGQIVCIPDITAGVTVNGESPGPMDGIQFLSGGLSGGLVSPRMYRIEPHQRREPEPQNPGPNLQNPQQDSQALFEEVKKECLDRKKAEADAARARYVDKFGNRIMKSMAIGAAAGALRGGFAGARGGAFFGGLGAVGATAQGAVVGGIFGAAGGVFTGVAKEPFHRLWYDARTYAQALNSAHIVCDVEARAAVFNAEYGGKK